MSFLFFKLEKLFKRIRPGFKVWKSDFFMLLSVFLTIIVLGINQIKDAGIIPILSIIAACFTGILLFSYIIIRFYEDSEGHVHIIKILPPILFLIISIIIVIRIFAVIVMPFNKAKELYDKDKTVDGKIISFININGDDAVYSNDILGLNDETQTMADSKEKNGFILLKTKYGIVSFYCSSRQLYYGDHIKVSLHFTKPSPLRNPGGFDENKYFQSNGIYLKGALVDGAMPAATGATTSMVSKSACLARSKIIRIFIKNLPLKEAGLMSGLLLGDRSNMRKEDLICFQKAGLSHITAVSGFAITFLLLPIHAIFRKVKMPKKIKSGIIFSILLFFGFITGWTPSISRALLMVFILIFAKEIHIKVTVIQALFITVSILLVINPVFALNIGFWLSGMATAGIVQLSGSIEKIMIKRYSFLKFIGAAFSTGMAAGISVLPFSIWISKEISISSILSNIMILPVVGFTTILGSIQTLAGMINENYFVTNLLAIPLKGLLFLIYSFAYFIGGIRFLRINTNMFSFLIFIAICIFVVFIFLKNKKLKRLFRDIAICFLIAGLIHTAMIKLLQPEIRIVFADVAQGDATLVLMKSGESILIDSGGKLKGTPVMDKMFDFYNIKYPAIYIVTHTHEDHCGGIIELIRERGGNSLFLPFDTIADYNTQNDPGNETANEAVNDVKNKPDIYGESNVADELIKIAVDRNLLVKEIGENDIIKIRDKFTITFYNPQKPEPDSKNAADNGSDYVSSLKTKSKNDTCLVMKIEYDGYKILIMGDATGETEKELIGKGFDLTADIYRIAHHGSPSSTNHDIISAVSPKISIISVGKNLYGHPSPKVIDRLSAAKCEILRTDMNGAILLEINNKKLQINTMIP